MLSRLNKVYATFAHQRSPERLLLCAETAISQSIESRRGPARGTKPTPRYEWDMAHLKEITGGKYTHEPLRVRRLGGRDPETGHRESNHVGGGVKFDYFMIDFHRRGPTTPNETYDERVIEVRQDPNRAPHIALVAGTEGKRWILATANMRAGQIISTTCHIPMNPIAGVEGNAYPLGALAEGTLVHAIERYPLMDSVMMMINAAGSAATVVRHQKDFVTVKMPHKHEFNFHKECIATVGRLSHPEHGKKQFGSAQMHRRFGYMPASGLWHKKTGYDGRKNRPIPPVKTNYKPDRVPGPKIQFSLSKRQLSGLFGTANVDPLIAATQMRF